MRRLFEGGGFSNLEIFGAALIQKKIFQLHSYIFSIKNIRGHFELNESTLDKKAKYWSRIEYNKFSFIDLPTKCLIILGAVLIRGR